MKTLIIDKELDEFKEHLNINERTVFSAKFGDGKTYFLSHFKERFKDDFEFITLYPVNYQIAENNDIFEYIKRDILIQMISKGMIDKNMNVPTTFIEQFIDALTHNPKSLIKSLIDVIPNLNYSNSKIKDFFKAIKDIRDFVDKLQKALEKNNHDDDNVDYMQLANDYLKSFETEDADFYEMDLITYLIIRNIKWYKEKSEKGKGKRIVLVIEDLDRIDPAHLFRILNIFSAHIDKYQQPIVDPNKEEPVNGYKLYSNKYGFDNIVTVFDYNCAGYIFHHFYGEKANYDGYINKFLSSQPFTYSINKSAHERLIEFFKQDCRINFMDFPVELKNKIYSLSIRDIEKILDGYNNKIVDTIFKQRKFDVSIKTICPLTKFISALNIAGIQKDEILNYINDISIDKIHKCLSNFIFLFTDIVKSNGFIIGKNEYVISPKFSETNSKIIEDVEFKNLIYNSDKYVNNLYQIMSDTELLHSINKKCVEKALTYIKD